ncbi:MAG: pyrroloquinoline quinone biosynthesis peptide chaperone PqqD [Thermorudis peleae]|nr:pyrroloquinoline quinone biosynthesis peptide chaperone PqqD [Thermorudis peleae]
MDEGVSSTKRPRLARQARMVWDPVRQRHVLLAPEGVLLLNETGAVIVSLCDGNRTVADIIAELRQRYDRVVEHEVQNFIARLVDKRWMELHDA